MTGYRMASVDTLARLCDAGIDGRHWYHYARRELANIAMRENTTFDRLCAVVAVTSPRMSVKKNLRLAVNYIHTGDCSKGYLQNVVAALAHYESTGEIRGPKTSAFYRNLLGDETALVLDVWMARALGVPDDAVRLLSVRKKAYKRISQIARARCYTVAQAQACIWTAIRDIYGKRPVNFDGLLSTQREHKYAAIYRDAAEMIESGHRRGMCDAIAVAIRHRHAAPHRTDTVRLISLAVDAMRGAYEPVGGGEFKYWGEIGAFGLAAATTAERRALSLKRRIAALHALADMRDADVAMLRDSFEETYRP